MFHSENGLKSKIDIHLLDVLNNPLSNIFQICLIFWNIFVWAVAFVIHLAFEMHTNNVLFWQKRIIICGFFGNLIKLCDKLPFLDFLMKSRAQYFYYFFILSHVVIIWSQMVEVWSICHIFINLSVWSQDALGNWILP